MSHVTYLELGLYILAILLATYAVWERFPEDYSPVRKLAFAGALLTLFLTFLLTSVRIDDVQNGLGLLQVDSQLKALAVVEDQSGKAGYDLARAAIKRMADLEQSKQGTLSEWEAIDFLAKLMREFKKGNDSLEVVAVSLNIKEFEKDAPAVVLDYENALSAIAKSGKVQRTYVLDKEQWAALKARESWLLSEGKHKPWLVPDTLKACKLEAIARHQRNGLECYGIPRSSLPTENSEAYDLIVMSRRTGGSPEVTETLFGANRRSNVGIFIHLGDHSENGRWLQMVRSLREDASFIPIPKWEPPPPSSETPAGRLQQ